MPTPPIPRPTIPPAPTLNAPATTFRSIESCGPACSSTSSGTINEMTTTIDSIRRDDNTNMFYDHTIDWDENYNRAHYPFLPKEENYSEYRSYPQYAEVQEEMREALTRHRIERESVCCALGDACPDCNDPRREEGPGSDFGPGW